MPFCSCTARLAWPILGSQMRQICMQHIVKCSTVECSAVDGTLFLYGQPAAGQFLTFKHVSDHVNVPCDRSSNATCQPNNRSFPVADS